MYYRAILKYAIDINFINIPFSIILSIISGVIWGLISFVSFGILIGFLGFNVFKKNEYFLYHNLGYTKSHLIKMVLYLNIAMAIVLSIIAFILSMLIN